MVPDGDLVDAAKCVVHIVEEDRTVCASLTTALNAAGIHTHTYPSAEVFLDEYPLESSHCGCILIDINLPSMDGLTLQLEMQRRGIGLPVVMIAAETDVKTAMRAMRAGAVDLHQHPFNMVKLVERMRETCARRCQEIEDELRRKDRRIMLESLSPRERDVLEEILKGQSNKQIAATLNVGIQTIAKHKSRVLKKLRVRNDLELILLLKSPASE